MMPSFRKLSPVEIASLEQPSIGARAQVAREYDAYVSAFVVGDYGRAELLAGERSKVVRGRLQAAARRHGLTLRFRPGPGPALIFRVEAAPPAVATPALPSLAGADRRRTDVNRQRNTTSPRPPRRRQTAAERYHEVLPRWMREERQSGRRNRSKQRTR
jgi:hypothetical protein